MGELDGSVQDRSGKMERPGKNVRRGAIEADGNPLSIRRGGQRVGLISVGGLQDHSRAEYAAIARVRPQHIEVGLGWPDRERLGIDQPAVRQDVAGVETDILLAGEQLAGAAVHRLVVPPLQAFDVSRRGGAPGIRKASFVEALGDQVPAGASPKQEDKALLFNRLQQPAWGATRGGSDVDFCVSMDGHGDRPAIGRNSRKIGIVGDQRRLGSIR